MEERPLHLLHRRHVTSRQQHGREVTISCTAVLGYALTSDRLCATRRLPASRPRPTLVAYADIPCRFSQLETEVDARVEAPNLVMSTAAIPLVADCGPAETDKARVSGH
jgi:hypothetical protein